MAQRKTTPELTAKRVRVARRNFPPGPDHPAARYGAEQRALILKLFRSDLPVKEIMRQTGASRDTVHRYCKAAGLSRRNKPVMTAAVRKEIEETGRSSRWKPGWRMVDGKPTFTG
jgi:DNA invertase Pin-like site-specific DNA recombinase